MKKEANAAGGVKTIEYDEQTVSFAASLFDSKYGWHFCDKVGWARFNRGSLISGSTEVVNAYHLMEARFEQTGF